MEQVQMYHEAVKPAGLTESAVATTAVPAGEAFLGISHSRPADASFEEPERLQLMAMLVPALKAGVHSIVRLEAERVTLGRALDALGDATLVCDPVGRPLHHSRGLEDLLAADPAAGQVLGEMRALAGSLLSMRLPRSDRRAEPAGTREVRTATARYRLRGTYVGGAALGVGDAVLVALDRLTPELPSLERLIERYGLTRREAAVALLLAQGLSNQQIAQRIAVSPHTARHHAEWVFMKLGVHSRKALGLKLLGWETE
jgi:DNA-binding CsgD family transcriptional regulator